MSKKIHRGRFTTDCDEPFVVFIVGMRVNKLWALSKWFPVFTAMPAMIGELYQNQDSGFLHTEYFLNWRGVTLIQYWRSYEDLEAYAHGKTHSTAWRNFNQKIGNDGTVGIFHETYKIEKNSSEVVYNNMPRFGLARAFAHVPVSRKTNSSRQRLKKHSV